MLRHLLVSVSFLTVLLTSSISITGCATGSHLPPELTQTEAQRNLEMIVVMGMNDVHGALAPQTVKTKEKPGVEPVEYQRGGASIIASHVRKLREDFKDRLLVLDAGDLFQGTLESNPGEGAAMVKFYNSIGVSAATLGNHEFDFGPIGPDQEAPAGADLLGALKARMAEARYPYIVANIIDRKTGKPAQMPNLYSRRIVQAGTIRVGLTGVITEETPVVTRPEYVKHLKFTDPSEAVMREVKELRKEGAQVIILLAHMGTLCHTDPARAAWSFRKEADSTGRCEESEELPRLLQKLPAGTLDVVVSGHTHQMLHHWIHGVPVIQAGSRAGAFNLVYLPYDTTRHELARDRIRIEGPVPVCPKVFENQKDCNGDRPAPKNGRGSLVTPAFHGHKISPDAETETLLEPVFAEAAKHKFREIATAVRPITHTRTAESEMGNLVADAVRDSVNADVAVINAGGIRANFNAGPITYEDLFRTLPFDNYVVAMQVTGAELKKIVRVAENGARGVFPTSGLKIRMVDLDRDAKSDDLNGSGKIEPWEVNRILDLRLADGSKIHDNKMYRLATIDFMVAGGDDMYWVMKQVPYERAHAAIGGTLRDTVENYIARLGRLNTSEKPLIDVANPRVELVKIDIKKKGKKSRGGKKRRH